MCVQSVKLLGSEKPLVNCERKKHGRFVFPLFFRTLISWNEPTSYTVERRKPTPCSWNAPTELQKSKQRLPRNLETDPDRLKKKSLDDTDKCKQNVSWSNNHRPSNISILYLQVNAQEYVVPIHAANRIIRVQIHAVFFTVPAVKVHSDFSLNTPNGINKDALLRFPLRVIVSEKSPIGNIVLCITARTTKRVKLGSEPDRPPNQVVTAYFFYSLLIDPVEVHSI